MSQDSPDNNVPTEKTSARISPSRFSSAVGSGADLPTVAEVAVLKLCLNPEETNEQIPKGNKHSAAQFSPSLRSSDLLPGGSSFKERPRRSDSWGSRPFASHQRKFSSPNVVRPLHSFLPHEEKEETKGERRGSVDSGVRKSMTARQEFYREHEAEINRIFKPQELRRRVGYDVLLDNYRALAQEGGTIKAEERRERSRKVYADGKFIGYITTTTCHPQIGRAGKPRARLTSELRVAPRREGCRRLLSGGLDQLWRIY